MKATTSKIGMVIRRTILFVGGIAVVFSVHAGLASGGAQPETFSVATYNNGILSNGGFEKDTTGTAFDDITDWDHEIVVLQGGNPPTGDDLEIVDNYYFEGQKALYSYLQTQSVAPFPGNAWVSQYLSTEEPVSTTADYISLWISGDGYTPSSRYFWRVSLVLTDGVQTYEDILRCDCWGANEGCTPNHYDYYDATETGADGRSWKRYTRSIPGSLDKSNLTVEVRHDQSTWDLTQADSWYRLDYIYFSDSQGNLLLAPDIISISDVGNDQGRQVTVSWVRALYDAPEDTVSITGYSLWRRIDALPSTLKGEEASKADIPSRLSYPSGDWHYVLTVPARGEDVYNCVAPTLCDSTADDGICWSVFFVSAMTPDPLVYFDSDPDSGYSVDNLAPTVPSSFLAAYNTGSGNSLSWDESPDADFDYFTIYRSTDPDFTPSSQYLVDVTTGTSWNDPDYDGWNVYYKITARDYAGNESDPAWDETPTAVANPVVPKRLALYQNHPNPFSPSTRISFTLPLRANAKLSVYNIEGKLVATLADDTLDDGFKEVTWNGKDSRGNPVSSGVYFYRLTAGNRTLTKKMVLLR